MNDLTVNIGKVKQADVDADTARRTSASQPLRALSVPPTGASGLEPLPDSYFRCESVDVAAFAALAYALSDLVGDLRFLVSPDGIRITEMIANENILVTMFITRDKFEVYECTKEMVLCFEPKTFYECINRHQNDTRMVLEVDPQLQPNGKKKKAGSPNEAWFMMVRLYQRSDSENKYEFSFPLELMRSYKQVLEAEKQPLDYFLAVDTTGLKGILSAFENLEKEISSRFVMIECTKSRLRFAMKGEAGGTIQTAACTMRFRKKSQGGDTAGGNTPRKKRQKTDDNNLSVVTSDVPRKHKPSNNVRLFFVLVYLLRLQKCFSMNRGFVFMKLRDSYPLSFEIHVGLLGELYVSLNNYEIEDDHFDSGSESSSDNSERLEVDDDDNRETDSEDE